jgi:hypothetical protein
MSETYYGAQKSLQRLRAALSEADEDTVYRFAFWCIGIAIMGAAIVAAFGWAGAAFCLGVVFKAAGESKGTPS